jgi:hypothetical protein
MTKVVAAGRAATGCLIAAVCATASELPARSFSSYREFATGEGTADDIRADSKEMDPRLPNDALVLGVMRELDLINQMHTHVFWTTRIATAAHPAVGISVNRKDFDDWSRKHKRSYLIDLLRFVLAHEQAHMLQYKSYDLRSLFLKENLRAMETQADILAGMSFSSVYLRVRDPDAYNQAVVAVKDFAISIGCWAASLESHPEPPQRARAVTLGFVAAFQYNDFAAFKATSDTALRKSLEKSRENSSDLPNIDWTTNTIEGAWPWSNRLAKKIGIVYKY